MPFAYRMGQSKEGEVMSIQSKFNSVLNEISSVSSIMSMELDGQDDETLEKLLSSVSLALATLEDALQCFIPLPKFDYDNGDIIYSSNVNDETSL